MTQNSLPTVVPTTHTGTDLSNFLNAWTPAINTMHRGSSRPIYAVRGTVWIDSSVTDVDTMTYFDGTRDVGLFSINTTTGDVIDNSSLPGTIFYLGTVDPTGIAPGAANGDLYIASAGGTVDPSFTGIGGELVSTGDTLLYDGSAWHIIAAKIPQQLATMGLWDAGTWDASGGVAPTTPAADEARPFYRISTAGTIGGVYYGAGDLIAWDGAGWYRILSGSTFTQTPGGLQITGSVDIIGGDIHLDDDQKLIFGDGDDLQIYVDSATNNTIFDFYNGQFVLNDKSDTQIAFKRANGDDIFTVTPSGSTQLMYNGTPMLQTADFGILITNSTRLANFGEAKSSYVSVLSGGASFGVDASGNMIIAQLDSGYNQQEFWISGGRNGAVSLYYDGLIRFLTKASGQVAIRSNGNVDSQARQIIFEYQNGTQRGWIGQDASGLMAWGNSIEAASVAIYGAATGGTTKTLFSASPDGASQIYFNGIKRFAAEASGNVSLYSDGSTDTESRFFYFRHQSGSNRGYVGHNVGGIFCFNNVINGSGFQIAGNSTAGAFTQMLSGDPDNNVSIFYAGLIRLITLANGVAEIRGDTNADTDAKALNLSHSNGSIRAKFALDSSGNLTIDNYINDGNVILRATSAGGVFRDCITADADAGVRLNYLGARALETTGAGAIVYDPGGSNPSFNFYRSDLTSQNGFIQFHATSGLLIRQQTHGRPVTISSEDGSGVAQNLFYGDPAAGAALYYAGSAKITTTATGVDITGAITQGGAAGAQANAQTGTTYTLDATDAGKMITMNNAAANTLTIPANASVAFPVGTEIHIMQLGAGATTVAITTDTLNVDADFTKVLAGQYSVATIKKMTSTMWVIFGGLVPA